MSILDVIVLSLLYNVWNANLAAFLGFKPALKDKLFKPSIVITKMG